MFPVKYTTNINNPFLVNYVQCSCIHYYTTQPNEFNSNVAQEIPNF